MQNKKIKSIVKQTEQKLEQVYLFQAEKVRGELLPLVLKARELAPQFEGIIFGMGVWVFLGDEPIEYLDEDNDKDFFRISDYKNYGHSDFEKSHPDLCEVLNEIEEIIDEIDAQCQGLFSQLDSFYFGPNGEIRKYRYWHPNDVDSRVLGIIHRNPKQEMKVENILDDLYMIDDKSLIKESVSRLHGQEKIVVTYDNLHKAYAKLN